MSHPDRSRLVIQNRKIVGEILHDYGKMRQLQVTVGVAYDTDLNRALALIQEVLRNNARVLTDPEPVIRVSLLAASSVNICVMPWSGFRTTAVMSEVNQSILETFRDNAIVIPLPQREVRLLGEAA